MNKNVYKGPICERFCQMFPVMLIMFYKLAISPADVFGHLLIYKNMKVARHKMLIFPQNTRHFDL